jgi:hypothetical protein
MQPFFPVSALDSARVVVLAGERVSNPPFPGTTEDGLRTDALPNFAFMAASTFVDTVVSHEAFTDRLLFHELVHVVQYEKLGLEAFASLSGGSYEAIPLEMNAYELDARFAATPTKAFSVPDEVQAWMNAWRF